MSQHPIAKKIPTERTFHGDTFADPYEWLRDKNDPEVIAYLTAQNEYVDAVTAAQEPLREKIFAEIKSRTQETDLSIPQRRRGFWYFTRTAEGKSYGISCRVPIAGPNDWTPPTVSPGESMPGEQVILDSNELAEGHEFFALGAATISDDGALLAYSVDLVGDERFTLRIRELSTGEDLPDEIVGIAYGATFSPDGRYIFYTTVDDAWRPEAIWRHEIGSSADDVRIFHEPDERFWVGIGAVRSGKYLVIEAGSKLTSEVLLIPADEPTAAPQSVLPRTEGVDYSVTHAVINGADRLLILTNAPGPNSELWSVPADDPTATPEVVIPVSEQVRLEDIEAFESRLVLSYRSDGLPRFSIADLTTPGPVTFVAEEFDEPLFSAAVGANPEWAAPTLRYAYESFVTPPTVMQLQLATGERTVLKRQPVLGGYDSADYEQHRDWATAPDGTRVPLSIVRRRGAAPGPTLLYGYGSYEMSSDPYFSVARLSLLDRGVTFVVAHVRGGGELGRSWYDNGKMLTKKNSFTDFVAAAQHLVDTGQADPTRMVAFGGSAGGLLVGAVANLAPQLFAGVLASVPFVDPLTSILDPSLPLTVTEWEEWGNPLADPQVYHYIKSYSPYENVQPGAYPAILAMCSLNDTRVLFTEPAKWVAALQEATTSGRPILLKTEMTAGHGGVSGRYGRWRETAFEFAWVLDTVGAS